MSFLNSLRALYSLETLDTRLTTSSTTPPTAANSKSAGNGTLKEQGDRNGGRATAKEASAPLWDTAEFYFYYVVVTIAVVMMIVTAYGFSQPTHPNYKNFEHLLSPGWILGRKVDNSDAQYASIRDNLPYLFLLLFAHPLLRRVFNAVLPATGIPVPGLSATVITAKARFEQRITFDRFFGLFLLVALHGFSAAKILLILYINHSIAHQLPRRYVPVGTWIFNIGILFANELSHGYPMATVAQYVLPLSAGKDGRNWGSYLDDFGGLIPRWEVLFKVTILRLISYNMDYFWSLGTAGSSPLEKKQLDPAALSDRDRVSMPAELQYFNIRTYLSYVLYSPLYIAGPILTFNDYVSQCHYPLASLTRTRVIKYGVRFLVALLTMEVMMHYSYAIAITKDTPDWSVYTPGELSMVGFFSLNHIWLKLLLPWRFFRLWALADGVDPPENMVRCVSDNYSPAAFWRSWHRSFNRWVVRYVYVPLARAASKARGASGQIRSALNLLTVFSFVAIWHDINLRLLIWGWMIVFFLAPEVLASKLFPAKRWEGRKTTHRLLCGLGAVVNILMMMSANLVGFAVGVDGVKTIYMGILGSWAGVVYLLSACVALFVGSQVMFEHREEEKRHGIDLRC